MERVIINTQSHILYPQFKDLYSTGFPVFEQRTEEQQKTAFSCSQYSLTAYTDKDILTGFIAYWEFPTYIYIEYFAINRSLRGKGIGSRLLDKFISENSKIVILEIDPVTDEISSARLRFYQKCGFYQNDYPHVHPAYRKGFKGHPLIVLTTGRKITKDEYDLFNDDLNKIIMKD